ncbi:MAG: PAS domain S-box protein, partial [Chloroflexota bacterium]
MSTLQQNTHLHDLLQQLQAHLDEPLEDYLARQLNERHEAQPATNTIEPLYYRALFDNTSDAVFIIGPDERHIDANPRAAAMLGYTLDEIRGEEADYFLAPGEAADAAQRKQQLADSKTGALPTYERKFQRKDGTLINCEISPIMMRDSNGAITHIYSVVRDITERKQAEQSIRDSEQTAREFQAHLKTLHNLHFELARATTLDDIYRQAVTTGKNVLGFDRMGLFIVPEGTDMVMGTYGIAPDGSLRREYDYQTSMAQWQAAIATEHSAHDQPVLWQTDAHLVDYDTVIGTGWHGMAALWDGNDVRGYVAVDNLIGQRPPRPYDRELLAFFAQTVAHAITRRQRIAELELSEESIRLLLESAPSAIILLDSDSNIQRTNLSAREIFRYAEPDSLIGLNIEVLVPRVWDYLSRMYPHHDPNDDLAKPPHLGLANDLAGITEDG